MKNWQLSKRILFIALVPVWAIMILLTVLIVVVGITEIDGALKARGALITRHLAPACEYGVFSGNREVLQSMAQAIMKEDDSQAVIITDTERRILAISGKPDVLTAEHQHAAMEGRISKGKGSLIFGAPIYQGNTEGDAFDLFDSTTKEKAEKAKLLGYVYLELSTASSQHSKNLFAIVSLLIGIVGTAFASVLALRMSNDLTRPLSRLIDGVHRMAQGDFSTRIVANSGGEIQELEDGFNNMASEIQRSHDEMLEINANLEKMVGERTRQLELKNQDLEYLSNTDRLTGLYNRFKLETILEEEHLRSQRYGSDFALTIIDVDKFKSVNDTYGHQVGDQVLISIGKILQKNVRSSDAVGRWGGEEFIVIFRETTAEDAIAVAEELRAAIEAFEFDVVGKRTASFGVAAYHHPDNISEMIRRADNALYVAKHHGRNRVEYKKD